MMFIANRKLKNSLLSQFAIILGISRSCIITGILKIRNESYSQENQNKKRMNTLVDYSNGGSGII